MPIHVRQSAGTWKKMTALPKVRNSSGAWVVAKGVWVRQSNGTWKAVTL